MLELRTAADDLDLLLDDDAEDALEPFDALLVSRLPRAWAAVGEGHLAGMLALFGVAARQSCQALAPDVTPDARAAHVTLRSRLADHLLKLHADVMCGHLSAEAYLRASQGLLRSHALRCFSAALSEAATQLRLQRSPRAAASAASVVSDACSLMFAVGFGVVDHVGKAQGAPALHYSEELQSELHTSGMLEHWAHLVLLLAGDGAIQHKLPGMLLGTFAGLHKACPSSYGLLDNGPCLSYLLSSHTIRLCATLDGGRTYGMPRAGAGGAAAAAAAGPGPSPELLPFFTPQGEPLRGRAGECLDTSGAQWTMSLWAGAISAYRQELEEDLQRAGGDPGGGAGLAWSRPHWRLELRAQPRLPPAGGGAGGSDAAPPDGPAAPPAALRRWVGCAAAPPLHARAACEVAIRLAAIGVAEVERGGEAPHAGRLRVAPEQAGALAYRALRCAAAALELVAGLPRVPPWLQRHMERYWRLLLALVVSGQRARGADGKGKSSVAWSWERLAAGLACLHVPETCLGGLPPAPTPHVQAALSAGFLSIVEKLLRRNGRALSVEGGDATSSWPLVAPYYRTASAAWCQMLAYGPRADVFSLLATAAHRLRRAYVGRDDAAAICRDAGRAVELLLSCTHLTLLLRWRVAEAAEAGGGAAAGYVQLRLAVSFIAGCLAPMLMRVMPKALGSEPNSEGSRLLVGNLLVWLTVLAAARRQAAWRSLVHADLECPALLRAALGQAVRARDDELLQARLRSALRALLALAPEALRAALREAYTSAALRCLLGPRSGQGGDAADAQLLAELEALRGAEAGADGGDRGGSDGDSPTGEPAACCAGTGAEAGPGATRGECEAVAFCRKAAALLASPEEVAAELPTPARINPRRPVNRAGPSEAGAQLPAVRGERGGDTRPAC